MDIESIFQKIIKANNQEDIHVKVQELKWEYVNDDWKNEFEDIDEAYSEQGRNGAESQVLNSIINTGVYGYPIMDSYYNRLFDKLGEHYELNME